MHGLMLTKPASGSQRLRAEARRMPAPRLDIGAGSARLSLGSGTMVSLKLNGVVSAGCLLAATLTVAVMPATAATYTAARGADGRPDLEGTWNNASLTRLERPAEYGERGVMSQGEVDAVEKKNSDLVALGNKPTDPKATVKDLPADCSDGRGNNCNYNAGWTDPGTTVMRVHGEPRTSFITVPGDGHVPSFTPEAVASGAAVRRFGAPVPAGL